MIQSDIPTGGTRDVFKLASWLRAGLVFAAAQTWSGIKTFSSGIVNGGSLTTPVTTVAAATYDLLATDLLVHVDYTTTGAVTSLTLPTAQVADGRRVIIKDVDGNAGTNNITIDTEGSETIDGAATLVIAANYGFAELYCDGTNWFVLGKLIA